MEGRSTAGARAPPPAPEPKPLHVLVCDDVRSLAGAIERVLLRRIPYVRVTTTHDAAEAHAAARERRFDAALVDFHLHGPTGLELCMRLHLEHPTMGLALMSAYPDVPLSLAGLGAVGVDVFLQKPFNPVSLTQVVRYAGRASNARRAQVRRTGALHVRSEMAADVPGDLLDDRRWCRKGHENPRHARFCAECGSPLAQAHGGSEPRGDDIDLAREFGVRLVDPSVRALYQQGLERMREMVQSAAAE